MNSLPSRRRETGLNPGCDPPLAGDNQPALGETSPWEAAYLRFETPAEEIRKFVHRLRRMGAAQWPRDASIAELFCGRGNGLRALHRLGFTRLAGVDLSRRLIEQCPGTADCHVCDCRQLPFQGETWDVVIIQGGLHHLHALPEDLDRTLGEISRVLKPGGRAMIIEPWLTPFLSLVHAVSRRGLARRLSRRIDALATMIDYERTTYERWLGQPEQILASLRGCFQPERCEIRWGKLWFLGRKG